jgi:crotonobetainyl-CoA:carnitine CoA-transferase CaiB-like acyl-CoA transferase
VADLVERAELLGLPVAALGETARGAAVVASRRGIAPAPRRSLTGVRVVDLSALWAGPVCAHLLGRAGAHVTKVESSHRPDGARLGPPGHFAALHDGHDGRVLDLRAPAGRAELGELIEAADVVIEGSRPRALRQLGFDAEALVAAGTVQVWVSTPAPGRPGPAPDRVGFGDDAAVAGGLVAWDADGPCFVGDALADPLTGLAAAGSVLEVLAAGGSWLVDAALARTAAFAAREAPDPPGPSTPPLPSGP